MYRGLVLLLGSRAEAILHEERVVAPVSSRKILVEIESLQAWVRNQPWFTAVASSRLSTSLRIVEEQLLLALLSDGHDEALELLRAQVAPEVLRGDEVSRIRQQLLWRCVMLARWHEGALRAALVEEEVSLKVHCGV